MHYAELSDLLKQETQPIKIRYAELYRILCTVLNEATVESQMDFSGPFARLTFLASKLQLPVSKRIRLNELRARCLSLDRYEEKELKGLLPFDILAIVQFMEMLEERKAPSELLNQLPIGKAHPASYKATVKDNLRVCVTEIEDSFLTGVLERPSTIDNSNSETLRICYADPENRMGNGEYLQKLIKKGTQLNLVKVQMKDGVCYPELIILEPDFLIDVSRLSRCFTECGPSPYFHILNMLQPSVSSYAILMGNMAGMLLDRELGNREQEAADYKSCAKEFMQKNALEILACQETFEKFHPEAMQQQQNIRLALETLGNEEKAYCREQTLLEPTFICELLGLQGRMDFLQDDLSVLLEQKSGKREFSTNSHREPHYVQMLLYQAMLHYSFSIKNDDISSFLLYSKFDDGLIKEGPAPKLLFEALKIRNQMVWLQFYMANGGSTLLEQLEPEHFNTAKCKNRLWTDFVRPKIAQTLDAFRMNDETTKSYVHRMLTFVAREHLLAKIGVPGREASGISSLWSCSLEEKIVAGSIYYNLTILPKYDDGGKTEFLTFTFPSDENTATSPLTYLPNFRPGESALLYKYKTGTTPDIRKAIVFRVTLVDILPDSIQICLRNPQHNTTFFQPDPHYSWAIEKDSTESSFATLYRSVYSILDTIPKRRQLLLGQRKPRINTELSLLGDYSIDGKSPHFNKLILLAKQAQDYFLLVGPPGTGKTSFGMRNILMEELSSSNEGVLLVSYTNRAIDEICSKLVEEGLDFLRISSPNACPPSYQTYLLNERAKRCVSIKEVEELLLNTRIVVGTSTSLTNSLQIFSLRSFGLAIIDEASQILEPQLLGLLCACHKGKEAIKRFVMIGDHKQLPAVVQQEACDSVVKDEGLRSLGLEDCRESLFQRLLRINDNPSLVFHFRHQGRMHPEVARFANETFYEGILDPVPLPHQKRTLQFETVDADNLFQKALSTHRLLFIPSYQPKKRVLPKANLVEAELIAETVKAVYDLYCQNNMKFEPNETIGVIVPYRHQIALVRNLLLQNRVEALGEITIDTVERFQGSQRNVIIFGFTVQMPYQLDFLCAQTFCENGIEIDRKLNVAMTRAKEQLVLIGNPSLLKENPVFRKLLRFVKTMTLNLALSDQ